MPSFPQKTLKILCLELPMRGNNWQNSTIVAADKCTIGGYTKWHPSAVSRYLLWLRELCSMLHKLVVMLYFLCICRHQRLHYWLCHVLLYYLLYIIPYPFDIVLKLKPKLLAEQCGIPAGYSVDFTTIHISCLLSRFLRIDHLLRMTRPICIAFLFSQWSDILWSLAWLSSYRRTLFRDITWFLISIRCMICSVCQHHIVQLLQPIVLWIC